MAQLVGSLCVHCQKRIGSILEGKFCKSCMSAFHPNCRDQAISRGLQPGSCPDCGCDSTQIKSTSDRQRREREELLRRDHQIAEELLQKTREPGQASIERSHAATAGDNAISGARRWLQTRIDPGATDGNYPI